MTEAKQKDDGCALVLGRPGVKVLLSVVGAGIACLALPQPASNACATGNVTLYQTGAPVIAVLFIGFTISRQDYYESKYAHPTYRRLVLLNVFLLLIALIVALRVLNNGCPFIDLVHRWYLDPIIVVGAIAFSAISLGLSFFRMCREKRDLMTAIRLVRHCRAKGGTGGMECGSTPCQSCHRQMKPPGSS